MTVVDIPENIKSIESAAFSGCASLAEVRLPWGLETLGERAFAEAPALARVVVPNTVDAESFARAFDHETTQCLWLYEMDGDALIGYNGCEAVYIDKVGFDTYGAMALDVDSLRMQPGETHSIAHTLTPSFIPSVTVEWRSSAAEQIALANGFEFYAID